MCWPPCFSGNMRLLIFQEISLKNVGQGLNFIIVRSLVFELWIERVQNRQQRNVHVSIFTWQQPFEFDIGILDMCDTLQSVLHSGSSLDFAHARITLRITL